ncbi:MAG: excinuclease ABC subunit UvrC [Gammaproteobacteria bacterium]|uniref:UvrABC system protein C n=1 Tax=Candidatus Thiopontia autotrophica TaxID=2841688 RepID=A0A8J6TNV8_9GAMM|nr:excinuclease ABC subunit UvrC [Candidatus Thiopontia autotrophica]MBL6985168.1 excinuclease ABC subunit UvrC [Candidatus Thioglobus sp.]
MERPTLPETTRPGVYRMLNADGEILYIGKARNLKKRVSSYFRSSGLAPKTRALMSHVASVEVTTTHTENEALILESNLIKRHRPRYNILLRDDKSYPYIYLSTHTKFPRLGLHRGARNGKGRYFGPYPSAGAVRESLRLMQKLFPVRQCEDGFFRNRSRPCLQHQIQRCSAPCTRLITPEEYRQDVDHAVLFLEGKSGEVVDDLITKMGQAASGLQYEKAARFRDQISTLRRVQERQYISGERGDLDVVAVAMQGGSASIQLFNFRHGQNLGNRTYFPKNAQGKSESEVLYAFLSQRYLEQSAPAEILVTQEPDQRELLQDVLSTHAGHKVSIRHQLRGDRTRWMKMAQENAELALQSRLSHASSAIARVEALQDALKLHQLPQRMECFDISHTMGEETVASCVVFEDGVALKSDYRRLNIRDIAGGDDYAAMRQALQRRYTRLIKGEGKLPDLLLIDGGPGQCSQASSVLEELQIEGVTVLGVAKGPDRRAGQERLFLDGAAAQTLPADSPALLLIQQIRDESHRFAITGHRQRRAKKRNRSPLEEISGVGPKRRQQLLNHFGGLQEIVRAGVEDISAVPGINQEIAQRIYDRFHE